MRIGAQPFKPFFWSKVNRFHDKSVFIERPTFRQMKRDLPALMEEYWMDEVTVFHSKRGEWGEYFSKFTLDNNKKLILINSGWM